MMFKRLETFSVNYENEVVNDVFLSNSRPMNTSIGFDDDTFQVGTKSYMVNHILHSNIEECLLISAPTLSEGEVDAIRGLSKKGIVIFLLLSENKNNQGVIEALSSWCHIRTGGSQSGMIAMADPQSHENQWGFIYSAHFGEECIPYSIALEADQIDSYYRLFCKLYWEKSQFEFLGNNDKLKCDNSNIGDINTNHQNIEARSLRFGIEHAMKSECTLSMNILGYKYDKIYDLVSEDFINLADLVLKLSLPQVNSQLLKRVVIESKSVDLFSTGSLPQFIHGSISSWLLPSVINKDGINWALKLSESQVNSISNYYQELSDSEIWTLKKSLKVGDINSPIRLSNNIEKTILRKDEVSIDLEILECRNFSEFESGDAKDLARKYNLTGFDKESPANSIQYQIEITPPLLSAQAKLDGLNKEWEKAQSKWNDKVSKLESSMQKIDTESKSLTDNIKGFMSSFLTGQLNKSRLNAAELKRLKSLVLSKMDKIDREEALESLSILSTTISETAKKLEDNIDVAEQKKRWKDDLERIQVKLDNESKKHSQAQKNKSEFASEERSKIEDAHKKLITGWRDWVSGSIRSELQDEFITFDLLQILGWCKDHSSNLKQYMTQDLKGKALKDHIKKSLVEIKRLTDNYGLSEKSIKKKRYDLNEQVKSILASIEGLKTEIETHEAKEAKIAPTGHKKLFTKIFGGNKGPSTVSDLVLPNEDLPKVGNLYRDNNQRLLAINHEDQIEQAKQCAMRLNSEIVVTREIHG